MITVCDASGLTGPFKIETRQGVIEAQLLRSEKGMVWVRRVSQTGQSYDTGLKVADIRKIYVPWPKSFDDITTADTAAKKAKLRKKLIYYARVLGPFRGLPGVRVDDAILRRGELLEQQEKWTEALRLYADVLNQSADADSKVRAQLRAGICRVALKEYEQALSDLNKEWVPSDEPSLLSEVCFARGTAFQQLERYDEAIMEYLYPVVFLPFFGDNEAHGLGAAMDCYVLLKDWSALAKTIHVLRTRYPESKVTVRANKWVSEHAEELSEESKFQLDIEENMNKSEGE